MDFTRLDSPAREAFLLAHSLGVRRGHAEVAPEHLLLALLRPSDGFASLLLGSLGARPGEIRSTLESRLERVSGDYSRSTRLSSSLEAVLAAAEIVADARGSGTVTSRHLLAGLLETGSAAADLLRGNAVASAAIFESGPLAQGSASGAETKGGPVRDLTAEAALGKLGPIVGREEVKERLLAILLRGTHHPVLLGEKGSGRSAVVEALAETIARGEAPEALRSARVLAVEPSFLEDLPGWIQKSSGRSRVLLFVEDPRALAQAIRSMRAAGGSSDVSWIGSATTGDYFGSLSRQPYLEGLLQTVGVESLSVPTTRLVLRGLRERLELRYDVRFRDDALEAATDLAARYLKDTKLPGAAIDLLERSAASKRETSEGPPEELARMEARLLTLLSQVERSPPTDAELAEIRTAAGWLRARWEQEKEAHERLRLIRKQLRERDDDGLRRRVREAEEALPQEDARLVHEEVTAGDVVRTVEKRSGVQLGGFLLDARTKLVGLEKNLGDDVLGQRVAVRAVVSALMRASVKIGQASGPGASFLFAGPPGVGKTEMARSLARHFLHDETALAVVHGDDVQGILRTVVQRPETVLVVRDVDRASSSVIRLLTRVLEDGLVRDPEGRPVDFRRAILVMCSREPRVSVLSTRVEAVVEFGPLRRDIVSILVHRHCRALSQTLAERRVELDWTQPAMEWLAERGCDREEGLHRLHRVLADEVGARLGRMLVLRELAEGSHARVEVREGRLEVSSGGATATNRGSYSLSVGSSMLAENSIRN
jgi:ATP-dependent Clp protease ATP-binding subunit ClpB